jgi:peptidoglycan/LPS O-acetylase OafA/YrhL
MKNLLPALTGVRYLLAVHVVLFHFSPAFAALPKAVGNFIGSGYVAVPMFFVLSGFVVTYTYAGRGLLSATSRRKFWIARVARIYPLYLLAFLITASFALAPRPEEAAVRIFNPVAAVAQVFTLHTWVPAWALTWNLPSWSIGVEFFFYLLFPFFALQLLQRSTPGRLVGVTAAMWILGTSVTMLYVLVDPDGLGFLGSAGTDRAFLDGFWIKLIKFNPLFHLPEFVIGVATGGIFLADLREDRRRNGALMTAAAGLTLLLVLTQSSYLPYPLLHNTTLAPLFAILILGLAHGGGPVARCLSTPAFVRLGNASYAVYILQFPLAVPIFAADVERMTLSRIGVYLALLTAFALLSERLFERPSRSYLKKKLSRLQAGAEEDAAANDREASSSDESAEASAAT